MVVDVKLSSANTAERVGEVYSEVARILKELKGNFTDLSEANVTVTPYEALGYIACRFSFQVPLEAKEVVDMDE